MKKNLFVNTILLTFLAINLTAQKDLTTNSISIFKNNAAFFIKSGTVDTKDGKYQMIDDLPRALFGTFWIHSSDLKSISSFKDEVKQTKPFNNTGQYLQANKGKTVELKMGNDDVITGTIEEVTASSGGNYLITIKTADSWETFSSRNIYRVLFKEKPNQLIETSKNKHILELAFNSKKAQQPLQIMYLQNGLGWLPV